MYNNTRSHSDTCFNRYSNMNSQNIHNSSNYDNSFKRNPFSAFRKKVTVPRNYVSEHRNQFLRQRPQYSAHRAQYTKYKKNDVLGNCDAKTLISLAEIAAIPPKEANLAFEKRFYYGNSDEENASDIIKSISKSINNLWKQDKKAYYHLMGMNNNNTEYLTSQFSDNKVSNKVGFSKILHSLRRRVAYNVGFKPTTDSCMGYGFNFTTSRYLSYAFNTINQSVPKAKLLLQEAHKLAKQEKYCKYKMYRESNQWRKTVPHNMDKKISNMRKLAKTYELEESQQKSHQ